MSRVTLPGETAYLNVRLRPVSDALHADARLRNEFLQFVGDRGGDVALTAQRLRNLWWNSRKAQYAGFFAQVLTEFGFSHHLLKIQSPVPPRRGRPRSPRA